MNVVVIGSTSKSIEFEVFDAETGLRVESVTNSTPGLAISYWRDGNGAATGITAASQTSTGAWTSGGVVHKAAGKYRLDVPNAAWDSGAETVYFAGKATDTDLIFVFPSIGLTAGNPRAATADANVIQWRGTQPNTLTSGRVESLVGAIGSGVITATSIASDAITNAKVADSAVTKIQSGLATSAALTTVDNEIAVIDGNVDTILSRVTANVATASALTTVDNEVGTILSRVTAAVATAADLATVDSNVDTLVSRVTGSVATAADLATVDANVDTILSRVTDTVATADDVAAIPAAVVEAELDALASVNRSSNTALSVTGPEGARSMTLTTDDTYEPIASISE